LHPLAFTGIESHWSPMTTLAKAKPGGRAGESGMCTPVASNPQSFHSSGKHGFKAFFPLCSALLTFFFVGLFGRLLFPV
jgi:hypothetical protein